MFKPEDLVPLLAVLLIFGTPVLAILTAHQRKMAEIFRDTQRQPQITPEAHAMREEIRELKELVHQQSIALDTFVSRSPNAPKIEERLGN